ncbi:4-hydroxythreonine-4-phosphate dehydrogenase PdxA [Cognatishimia sp.]|uniref:4-hydroxythreonine-4-phosphate dehydrogenase PdxA n=1 Tax=Cognatishimia sp. TaxID=2211648 RepID=UPI0035131934|nr:4-hydroxythreonine-4-phosphate dehydrogenase PdxA [Cognatishimia sp.]
MTQAIAPIALTCGEPGGVGLELAEKAWEALRGELAFFLIADPGHLGGAVPHQVISDPSEAASVMEHALPVLAQPFAGDSRLGEADPANAQGVIDTITRAVSLTQSGQSSAVCTAPIHKKALKDGAGFTFPGHTEFLAHLAGVERVVMMLACESLRVVPTTIHIPLQDVPKALTADLLEGTIWTTVADLTEKFGISKPRVVVSGLNPHAGEGGAMGHEDAAVIAPVVQSLAKEGMAIEGPLPADTMFHARARATYDVAVCMYHDQALIPIKTLDFDRGVNVTLGLPFIRTSPDHGTAFDIAGKGIAKPESLIAALRMARDMAMAQPAADDAL